MTKITSKDFKNVYMKLYVSVLFIYIFIGNFLKGGDILLGTSILLSLGIFQVIFLYKDDKFKIDISTVILITINIILLVSTVYSYDVKSSLRFDISFFTCTLFILIYKNLAKESLNEYMLKMMYAISIIYSYISIAEFIIGEKFISVLGVILKPEYIEEIYNWFEYSDRITGIGIHPGLNAFVISIGLYLLLTKYLFNNGKMNIFQFVNFIIMIMSIIKTGNRNVLISFIVVFLIVRMNKMNMLKKLSTGVKYILLIIAIYFTLKFMGIEINTLDRFIDGSGKRAMGGRMVLYSLAVFLFSRKPIFGNGINTFLPYTYLYNMPEKTYTHNVILQLLCEVGVIGTVVFLLYFIFNLVGTYKLYKRVDRENQHLVKFCLFGQFMIILNSITANPLYELRQLIIYFMVVAISLNLNKYVEINKSNK